MPPPRNVSGALPTRSFFFAAVLSTGFASAVVRANGFSVYACLPALSAARLISACAAGMVRLRTISTSGSRSSSSTEHARAMLNSLAFASAAARFMPAQATIWMLPNAPQPAMYCAKILPQPITPTLVILFISGWLTFRDFQSEMPANFRSRTELDTPWGSIIVTLSEQGEPQQEKGQLYGH